MPTAAQTRQKVVKVLDRAKVQGHRADTWAGELSGASHEVIERAMAHKVGNVAEQAYARSDLLDQRRELMQAWADYLAK